MAQKRQLTDAEIKAQVLARTQKEQPDNLFPTEIVPLPSRGLVYPLDNPLSKGKIEIRYMTAKDEDILTNQNYLKRGVALDKLYESIVVGNGEGEPVNVREMITGDKSAVMLASRILGYGSDYEITVKHPQTGREFQHIVDLNQLKPDELDEGLYNNTREFEYKLPVSEKVIKFKLVTDAEQKAIAEEIEKREKAGMPQQSVTTQLKHTIISVDGNDERAFINSFISNHLLARDSLSLRNFMADVQPDYDLKIYVDAPDHGFQDYINLPINVDFFWPRA